MIVIHSHNGIPIRLTDERWRHIAERHPELVAERTKVLETIADPEMIQEGDFGERLAIRWYNQTSLGAKYVVVAYRELENDDGFVVTAYITRKPSARRMIIWKR
jgi:hypothetical protein